MNLKRITTSEMELWVRESLFDADAGTAHEVQDRDIYRVKQLHASGFQPKVIVDIGGHIATFTTLAAKYWPESRIYIFEPSASFPCLAVNLPPNAIAVNTCVLGFAGYWPSREILPSHQDEAMWRASGKAISFKQVLNLVGGQIDFLKIDCEQSEVNIFREMDELDAFRDIEYIHGEWHLPLAREMVKTLVAKTHTVELIEGHDNWDSFWAKRNHDLPARVKVPEVFGITLASTKDRTSAMVEHLITVGFLPDNLHIFDGVNGKEFSLSVSKWSREFKHEEPYYCSPGQIGLIMSHREVWQHLWHKQIEEAIIVEDDVLFGQDFLLRFPFFYRALPEDWQFVYIGGYDQDPYAPRVNDHITIDKPFRTHAYMVKRSALPVLLAMESARNHIDVLIRQHALPKLKHYCFSPSQAKQRTAEGHWQSVAD